ncbi:hypothetical protein BS78_02G200900 [Paspalum vaginatum]|nr:hypothetical protein BS78_02G200900 [Paspalum vaginatum]
MPLEPPSPLESRRLERRRPLSKRNPAARPRADSLGFGASPLNGRRLLLLLASPVPPGGRRRRSAVRPCLSEAARMTKYMRNKRSYSRQFRSSLHQKRCSNSVFKKIASQELAFAATEKCAWTDATCPVCMEYPHNAVLLLCSSHGSGCRPYICASDFQHSNCLDQLVESCRKDSSEDPDAIELACPLCRGEVKGYTLVEPARKQLNHMRRSCMQDGCSYMGTYRELCKHVKKKHRSANPRAVDPLHAYRWKRLIFRSSLQDMVCSTTSSLVRRLLSVMLQFEELMASTWQDGGDYHGTTNDDSLQSANAESIDP